MRWFGSRGSITPDAAVVRLLPAAAAVSAVGEASTNVARAAADAARARLYRLTECAPPATSAAWLNPPTPSRHR
jgi:hypothetical protein